MNTRTTTRSVPARTTLRPLPRDLGSCPSGHGSLRTEAIHHPGARPLFRGRCPVCDHVFLQDLPIGQGLLHPCSLDLATGATHGDPAAASFCEPLRTYYERPDARPVQITVDQRRSHAGPAVLLDWLGGAGDRAQRELLDAGPRHERCIALVPRALQSLVPEHVDEVWVVDADARRLRSWLLDLDAWVQARLDTFADGVSLSAGVPHPGAPGSAEAAPAHPILEPLAGASPSFIAQRAARARSIVRTAGILSRRGLSQIRARRVPLPAVLTDSRGARFELVDRGEVAQFLEHRGHFEAAELDLLKRYLRPGDIALDVGANLGHFAATMGLSVGPQGRVHAFEPLASNRNRLRRTLELNKIAPRVHVEAAAVTAQAGEVQLVDYGEGYGSWATTKPAQHDLRSEQPLSGTAVTVPAVTLDEHCARHGLDHVAALKIDVEGAELDVLDGAEAFLTAGGADLLIVECSDATLHAAGRSSWELAERLGRRMLRTYELDRGTLVPHRAAGWTQFANVIALSPAARDRLGL